MPILIFYPVLSSARNGQGHFLGLRWIVEPFSEILAKREWDFPADRGGLRAAKTVSSHSFFRLLYCRWKITSSMGNLGCSSRRVGRGKELE